MKYTGTCHCKKVKYEVDITLDPVIVCNCSHCQIKGLLLSFTPTENFTLLSGEEHLTSYKFNKKVINHVFCNICGVESFAYAKDKNGKDTTAINVRCLEGVDLEKITLTPVDGKSW